MRITDDAVVEIAAGSSSEAEDIVRCLKTLYGSHTGEQGVDRDFGIDQAGLSLPIESAKAVLTAEFVRKTARYEPRARVVRVDWMASEAAEGQLKPRVVIEIVGD